MAVKDYILTDTELVNIENMEYHLSELAENSDQDLWNWFMDNMGDRSIYAGNAVHEDYINIMDEQDIKACYSQLHKG